MDNEMNPGEMNPNAAQPIEVQPAEAPPALPPAAPPYMQQPYIAQPQAQHPYRQIGGWLLFFVICNILGMVTSFFGLWGDSGIVSALRGLASGKFLPLVENLVSVAVLALSVIFLAMLFRRDARFLRFRQLGWIVSFFGQAVTAGQMLSAAAGLSGRGLSALLEEFGQLEILELFEEFAALLGMSAEGMLSAVSIFLFVIGITTVLGGILYFFLMTLYYSRSVRVRTYMGSEEYLRLAVFTKKADPRPAVPDEPKL